MRLERVAEQLDLRCQPRVAGGLVDVHRPAQRDQAGEPIEVRRTGSIGAPGLDLPATPGDRIGEDSETGIGLVFDRQQPHRRILAAPVTVACAGGGVRPSTGPASNCRMIGGSCLCSRP